MVESGIRLQDYSLSAEQEWLRETFHKFFEKECPTAVVRSAEPLGFDAELWQKLLRMGIASMGLPPSAGGDGATLIELGIIAEEVGRSIAPVPFISHIVATRLLAATNALDDVLIQAIHGYQIVTLALQPLQSGQPQLVPDAAIAAGVVALVNDELSLYRRGLPAGHVENHGRTPLGRWQPSDGAECLTLARGDEANTIHRHAVMEWKILMAAALVGLTEASLRLAVDFAKARYTMGVPIGSLQGVAFPLADVAIGVAGARNLTRRAAWTAEYEPASSFEIALMSFANAARLATRGTTTSAHMQGGLGFTAEADASLFFLRSKGWGLLAGDPMRDFVTIGESLVASNAATDEPFISADQ